MSQAVLAYIPVLHEGYRRFVERHARGKRLYVIGPELYADYRPLAKDIRALDASLVASAIASWGVCSEVHVLDLDGAVMLASEAPSRRAASMISSGTESSAWRTRNVPSALAANGSTSALKVFVSDSFENIRNTETNVTCAGTSRHATTSANAVFFPTKRSFASA